MSGIALAGATVIAAAPIAATSRDVEIANPAVQLTATPFEEYQALISNSLKNIQGLIEQALAAPLPPSDLRFTLDSLISGLFDVNANIAAFRKELSGRHGARSHGQGLRWRLEGAPRHPIRLPPLPDPADACPHAVTVVHTFPRCPGRRHVRQAIRRLSPHVRSVIDCFRNRRAPQAAPQAVVISRRQVR
jgi:hypothetical protein